MWEHFDERDSNRDVRSLITLHNNEITFGTDDYSHGELHAS